ESVADGDLTERLELTHARDLLDRLSRIFNEMTRRLQSSFRQANRFSSDASHELRTPLTILRGQLENALQKAEGDRAVELAGLLDQTERLRGIIDGLLLLSRSDAGKLTIGYDEEDFSKLVTDVIQDFESALSESGICLESEIAPNLKLRGDPGLLRQAIGNLISNAEKFNLPEKGRISIHLKQNGEELWLSVENTGTPIDPDQTRDVFRRFFRASGDRESPTAPGTGLGLSIVEAVAEAHGGRAWCEPQSASNRFVLAFPKSEDPSA
ncbi:MAG: ATP-binding protein, partial [Verrucomicrobiota bacterium]